MFILYWISNPRSVAGRTVQTGQREADTLILLFIWLFWEHPATPRLADHWRAPFTPRLAMQHWKRRVASPVPPGRIGLMATFPKRQAVSTLGFTGSYTYFENIEIKDTKIQNIKLIKHFLEILSTTLLYTPDTHTFSISSISD